MATNSVSSALRQTQVWKSRLLRKIEAPVLPSPPPIQNFSPVSMADYKTGSLKQVWEENGTDVFWNLCSHQKIEIGKTSNTKRRHFSFLWSGWPRGKRKMEAQKNKTQIEMPKYFTCWPLTRKKNKKSQREESRQKAEANL